MGSRKREVKIGVPSKCSNTGFLTDFRQGCPADHQFEKSHFSAEVLRRGDPRRRPLSLAMCGAFPLARGLFYVFFFYCLFGNILRGGDPCGAPLTLRGARWTHCVEQRRKKSSKLKTHQEVRTQGAIKINNSSIRVLTCWRRKRHQAWQPDG